MVQATADFGCPISNYIRVAFNTDLFNSESLLQFKSEENAFGHDAGLLCRGVSRSLPWNDCNRSSGCLRKDVLRCVATVDDAWRFNSESNCSSYEGVDGLCESIRETFSLDEKQIPNISKDLTCAAQNSRLISLSRRPKAQIFDLGFGSGVMAAMCLAASEAGATVVGVDLADKVSVATRRPSWRLDEVILSFRKDRY